MSTYTALDQLVEAIYDNVPLDTSETEDQKVVALRKAMADALRALRKAERAQKAPTAANAPFKRVVIKHEKNSDGGFTLHLSCGHAMPLAPRPGRWHLPLTVKCWTCKYPGGVAKGRTA